ncbi:MAG: ACT domain-containing protein [Gammaproteobacteria bacterium]|nr:ACT domain-containing protein [Gammaproteobacteria bacterium]
MSEHLISLFCPDRPGLISAISGCLFDLDLNIGDSNFSILGSGAKFTAVCTLPETLSAETLHTQLQHLPQLNEAKISITPYALARPSSSAHISHQITLQGRDQPGLVTRLTEVFAEFEANIVHLNTKSFPQADMDHYLIRISVAIPKKRTSACLATIENTASSMQMECLCETEQSATELDPI